MGTSLVVTHVILFIAVLGIATGLLVAIKNYADETEAVFNEKADKHNQMIATSINIDVVRYSNVTNTTFVYVRNTGSTVMDPARVDLYIDGIYISRNSNRSVEILTDTEVANTGKWDPREMLLIKANMTLDPSVTHEVTVVTPYSIQDKEGFSV